MSEAEHRAAQGAGEEARALYLQAAYEEAWAYDHIPAARGRTRGIIAVSAVALYYRAGALDEAIRHAHRYLKQDTLPDFARAQLEALVNDSQREQRAPA
jgi:hypothetical protein